MIKMEHVEIIAEVANAHQGDPNQAVEIARLAACGLRLAQVRMR